MEIRFAALATLVGLMAFLFVAPAAAAPPAVQGQGAAGLVNALVGRNGQLGPNQVGLVNIGKSLNNVLNNSPILSSNNVLNNSPILNNNVLNGVQIAALNNFLNNNNIAVGQVPGVAVLSGGGIAVIV